METQLVDFITLNVGVTYKIVKQQTIDLGVSGSVELLSIIRNDKLVKQFTLYIIETEKLNFEVDVDTVETALNLGKNNDLFLLRISKVSQFKTTNNAGLFVLCCDSITSEECLGLKITTDVAKYFYADLYHIIDSIKNNKVYLSVKTITFKQDAVLTTLQNKCEQNVSPIPHLLLSPLSLILPVVNKQFNTESNLKGILDVATLIEENIEITNTSDLSFLADSKGFLSMLSKSTEVTQQTFSFLNSCQKFQDLPRGNLDDYKAKRFISHGSFGLVFEVEKDGKCFAMKQSCRADLIQREARAMRLFDHPNLLSLFDYIESSESFAARLGIKTNRARKYYYIVMECCQCSLMEYIQSKNLSKTEISSLLRQINEGLRYLLNEKKMVHRDIKLENILLKREDTTKRLEVKIADYGFCRVFNKSPEHGVIGTPIYLCPEIACFSCPTVKSDLYSVGVMIYKMVTGVFPKMNFSTTSGVSLQEPEATNTHFPYFKELVEKLITNENERISWESYFSHPFFISC
ncbi:DNA damage response protein kinase DUN1, putative [Entamoeba invadens IP1]|uniref:DNA damage response protein kinase DUN1, putative n=1 Tax=Entamoeba invadens IP1 TaxID=370355 RepID=A0A0A1U070_ENTIV|nr:DNA damage response protein kinase DUN1, putative [Entamoeba invadens IP1]ELP84288.1 DNA damage response protein kinase DUN1, putative [Entamoeba invadens IP1]|eukprot:XP_004183634.1 DNA damage response protein kinase DUN1, putative [Entamoeba invadens IP1]